MSIIKLNNPKTSLYYNLKKTILHPHFSWHYMGESTPSSNSMLEEYVNESKRYIKEGIKISNPPMYVHSVLGRSTRMMIYPLVESEYIKDINEMYCELFNNNINIMKSFHMMCRCCVNAVEPSQETDVISIPHVDHEYPHKNIIIYLTDAGGSTFVEGEEFAPEEDDVIMFEGLHWHKLPRKERRVVLVMTYI